MLRIRLTSKNGGVNTLLDKAEIPMIENLEELNVLAKVLGKMLSKYTELITDPSILSALVDPTITQWTVQDFESLDLVLAASNLEVFVTSEDQEEDFLDNMDLMYLMVDNSYKELGVFPTAQFQVIENKPEIIDLPGIIGKLLPNSLFREGKFYNNPMKAQLDNLETSKQLVGAYDAYTINKVYENLDILNKKLITIVLR